MTSTLRTMHRKDDSIVIIIKNRDNNDSTSEQILEYDLRTKIGKIREDLFLSPWNTIDDRKNFSIEFMPTEEDEDQEYNHNVHLYNKMDNLSRKDLDSRRLTTLGMVPDNTYYFKVYDRSKTTNLYVSHIYRTVISIAIFASGLLFGGICIRVILWIIYNFTRLYRLIESKNSYPKQNRPNYRTIIGDNIYEWVFASLMCYDIYTYIGYVSPYSTLYYIASGLCLYHILERFKKLKYVEKDRLANIRIERMRSVFDNNNPVQNSSKIDVVRTGLRDKTTQDIFYERLKLMVFDILFVAFMTLMHPSPYQILYSGVCVWTELSDIYIHRGQYRSYQKKNNKT